MKKPSLFLCHSTEDKSFARRIGNDLRSFNLNVWIDEAEIKVGDSLIEKISAGIESVQYMLAIISANSVSSNWVQKELNIALTKEIKGRKIKILPCLLDDCEIPTFLIDRKYADFRNSNNYSEARNEIIRALGLSVPHKKEEFFDKFIYHDLTNLNDGFDTTSIKYFSNTDFFKVLERIEIFKGSVYGIESWPDKEFGVVKVYEDYTNDPSDPNWYKNAFQELNDENSASYLSISGSISPNILNKFL